MELAVLRGGAVEIDTVWAYRARSTDDAVVPVRLLKEGTKKPARVLVRFEDPAAEGREEWVPPVRLKVRWSDVAGFLAREARWKAVRDLSPHSEDAQVRAAETACEFLVEWEVAHIDYKDAHLSVSDPARLAELAGVDPAYVTSHPAGFVTEEGVTIVPWPVAVEIVKRLVARNPDPILQEVTTGEAKARYEAIHGEHLRNSRGREVAYIEPERAVEFDQEYDAPRRKILREWAGDAVERWDELIELRKEVKRVGDVAEKAIDALRRHGHGKEAGALASELGMTVPMLRVPED
jgi:hypothetical protein